MGQPYASGKRTIGLCDRCGRQGMLNDLRKQVVKGEVTNLKVCGACLDKDHPQLFLGTVPIVDPQAVREPRPDNAITALRDIQWGWNPVGGAAGPSADLTPNDLQLEVEVGDVTVVTA